jgi:diguanylate cyclase (GGDEF)-like protein
LSDSLQGAPAESEPGGLSGLALEESSLYAYFAERLPERLREVEEGWRQVRETAWSEEAVKTLHRLAHSLAGAGATFGFLTVTEAARDLEKPLKAIVQSAAPRPDDSVVEGLLDGLRRAARPANAAPPAVPEQPAASVGPRVEAAPGAEPEQLVVLLLESDPELGAQLARQLGRFGYRVRLLGEMGEIEDQMEHEAPRAILLDLDAPTPPPDRAQRIASLRRRNPAVKIAFLSSRTDLEARLEAVRAGGEAFFTKPVDVGTLVERLDLLTGHGPGEPYRILILDDDPDLASYYAEVLTAAGMQAMASGNPLEIMDSIAAFQPDLILLDVYMPACAGSEIAAVLRQREGTLSTPVVFLSTENGIDEQLAALTLGGDEFLTKPIAPRHLVAAVAARSRHSRLLRSLIANDGLTGLLNHSTLIQRIESEVSRASRFGGTLSCAMLDVDHFKQINDSYGHAAGDRLLRSLSLFLKQRLRRSDIIGRYGGDEIAVLLPHTDSATAHQVVSGICQSFAQIRHHVGATTFTATLTGGIATYPALQTPEMLIEAADHALYTAKRAGRDRVEIYSP